MLREPYPTDGWTRDLTALIVTTVAVSALIVAVMTTVGVRGVAALDVMKTRTAFLVVVFGWMFFVGSRLLNVGEAWSYSDRRWRR